MKAVTADTVLMTVRDGALAVLLTRRPGTVWRIPGGEPGDVEPLARAATRTLREQTGVAGGDAEQLFTFDLSGGGVRVCYVGLVAAARHAVRPGPDEVDVRWFPVADLPGLDEDDRAAIDEARERVRAKSAYAPVAAAMLPGTFTIGELQGAYEAALGVELDARNFRRDILAAGVLSEVGATRPAGPGRPARLYRWSGGSFAVAASERRAARTIAALPPSPAEG